MRIPSLAILALSVVGCAQPAPRGLACSVKYRYRPSGDSAQILILYCPDRSSDSLVRVLDSLRLDTNVKRAVLNTFEDTTFHSGRPKP